MSRKSPNREEQPEAKQLHKEVAVSHWCLDTAHISFISAELKGLCASTQRDLFVCVFGSCRCQSSAVGSVARPEGGTGQVVPRAPWGRCWCEQCCSLGTLLLPEQLLLLILQLDFGVSEELAVLEEAEQLLAQEPVLCFHLFHVLDQSLERHLLRSPGELLHPLLELLLTVSLFLQELAPDGVAFLGTAYPGDPQLLLQRLHLLLRLDLLLLVGLQLLQLCVQERGLGLRVLQGTPHLPLLASIPWGQLLLLLLDSGQILAVLVAEGDDHFRGVLAELCSAGQVGLALLLSVLAFLFQAFVSVQELLCSPQGLSILAFRCFGCHIPAKT
ncbi:uncharacterized protein LOC117245425 [Parus major]|uniref:uncharacterized protein LOC117245425 n=1 Tax=Parus major TaxID=9157 RepID=UPI00144469A2|nr:uncharacterized protein LOC117245425 [Parus major]